MLASGSQSRQAMLRAAGVDFDIMVPNVDESEAKAALLPNRPNPFNPHTVLGFAVPGTAPIPVRITVHSVDGRLVRTLVSRRVEPGYHEALWDGRNESGVPVASGIYIGRAVIGGAAFARKMTLLR